MLVTLMLTLTAQTAQAEDIVTQDNFGSYFDKNGKLLDDVPFNELIFQGNFTKTNLGVSSITLDRTLTITGDNAVLNDIGFIITGPDVTLDKMTLVANSNLGNLIDITGKNAVISNLNITYNGGGMGAVAINVAGDIDNPITGVKILNNTISFESHVTDDEEFAVGLKLTGCKDAIVDGNKITTKLPCVYVNTYDEDYYIMGADRVNAVRLKDCKGLVFKNNTIHSTTNDYTADFPTIQSMQIIGCDDLVLDHNNISLIDEQTPAGNDNYIYGINFGDNKKVTFSNNNFKMSTTGGKDAAGTAYAIQNVESKVNIIGNSITSISKGPNLGIYVASVFGGNSDFIIEDNFINVTGFASSQGSWALVSGIEIQNGDAKIHNNKIYTYNVNAYDENAYIYGISYAQWMYGDRSFDIQNNTVYTEGKYAISVINATSLNVEKNTLYAHELCGDNSVNPGSCEDVTIKDNKDNLPLNNIVTQSNFDKFFDDNGVLLDNVTFDELIFKGDFADLVSFITLDRKIIITGDNAVLNNIALNIIGDDVTVTEFTFNENNADFTTNGGAAIYVSGSDVTLDNVSVTYNAPNEAEAKAIFANGAENFTLTNSEITFTGANPGEYHYRGLEVRNCNGAVIDKNTITATFPAVTVDWGETGIDQDYVLAVGIQGGNDVEFTNNRVTVNTNGDIGSYPTIDAIMVYSANDILIKGNNITHLDTTTEDSPRYYYTLDIYSTTGTVEANDITINTTTTPVVDRAGTAYPIQLNGPFTVTVKNNNVTCISKGPVAGIYATNWGGAGDLIVENNIIDVTGYATTSNYALVAGIEAEIGIASELDRVMVYNNTITVENGADYDDANQVIGVGFGTSGFSGDASADIKYNDITVDGKYAVYYAKAKDTNVTENVLIAHELTGDAAVYIADGDGNTVQDNLPESMASIVTQSNFNSFFDENGILRDNVTSNKLFFKGNFSNSNNELVPYIILDRAITITGVGAVLNNMGFVIVSEDVTLDKMTLTATTSLGDLIYVGASNVDLTNLNITYTVGDESANVINVAGTDSDPITDVNILNNTINFESHATSDEDLVTAINLNNVENVVVDGNTIAASLPALYVNTYDWNYFMMGLCNVNPVRVYVSNSVELTNNKIDVTVNSYTSSYSVVQALYIVGSKDIHVKGNDFKMVDTETPAGTPIYLYAVECGFSDGIEFIDNNFDISTKGGQSGNGSVYVLQVATTEATFIGNNITCKSNGPSLGIYSPYGFGPAKDLVIKNNFINVTGLATGSSDYALISGIEIQTGYATIYNNTINVQNKGGYDDSYPVSGVSAIQYSASTLSFDIQDNDIYVPDGKYAVKMLYAPSEATVTENALIAHELTGDAAVYIYSGDDNTVENNLDAFVNMPKTGESTYNIPANVSLFKVYDDGGQGWRYSPGCDGTLTLTAPEGYLLQLSGNIKTEKDVDYLTVYDGSNDQADKLIDQVSSSDNDTETAIPTVISTGNVMTLNFCSNNSGNDKTEFDGLNLTVRLVYNLNETEGITDAIATKIADKPAQFTRTGITANAYSTVCLPFDFTAPTDCTIYGFQGIHYDENALAGQGAWVADIAAASTMNAHTPYIFKSTGTEVTFSGTASDAADYSSALESNAVSATVGTDQAWTFKGTYSAIDWTTTAPDVPTYGFSTYVPAATIAAGTFVRFVQGASLAPFRARLIYSGTDTHLNAPKRSAVNDLPQYIIVRIVGADGGTTAIGTLDTCTGEISTGDWFDLNGRRLSGKPTQKGLYIVNGNKVVIK